MAYIATFAQMGLRTEKAVATHLLLENAHESNLVPDIRDADYLAGHLGRTHLRPLEGLPTFVDDIYVFGYLCKEDCVAIGGRLSCTTGPDGAASQIVGRISTAVDESMGRASDGTKRGYIQSVLVHTLALQDNAPLSTIRATIARIENDTKHKARIQWVAQHEVEPIGVFVAKVGVSEIPIDELQEALPTFDAELLFRGYGIYSIDYTRDYSGVLDRKTLVEYLCEKKDFREQGDLAAAMGADAPTILANTDSVGNHVCTWVYTSSSGNTVRTKLYNKVVSNFEAGEIREPIGGHLADYVDCPNQHLRRTFLHPDVQARGCTRIEVSLYACRGADLSTEVATEVVQEALDLVSPRGATEPLFVVQPPSKQWENLSLLLDRCLVLADRPQGEIFVAWYAHTTTRRVSGVRVRPTKANADDDQAWNKAVEWAAGDFGFRAVPIFRVDILSVDDEGVEIAPLRCYTKDAESRTILAASKRPTQLHPEAPDPDSLLPPSTTVSWVWRTKKAQAMGRDISLFLHALHEVPTTRTISALSTKGRALRLQQLWDAASAEDWHRRHAGRLELERQIYVEAKQRRVEELEALAVLAAASKEYARKSTKTFEDVGRCLRGPTSKIGELLSVGPWTVLGYRTQPARNNSASKPRVVLRTSFGDLDAVVWATQGLQRALESCADLFEKSIDDHERTTYWLVAGKRVLVGLEIEIDKTKTFLSKDGRTIYWNPLRIVSAPKPDRLALLQHLLAKEQEHHTLATEHMAAEKQYLLQQIPAPIPKHTTKALDILPGEYLCRRYARTTYRGAARTILYLLPTNDSGEPTTDIEIPTYGYFLEKEIDKMFGGILHNLQSPLLCRVGEIRTTAAKRKDRLVSIAP